LRFKILPLRRESVGAEKQKHGRVEGHTADGGGPEGGHTSVSATIPSHFIPSIEREKRQRDTLPSLIKNRRGSQEEVERGVPPLTHACQAARGARRGPRGWIPRAAKVHADYNRPHPLLSSAISVQLLPLRLGQHDGLLRRRLARPGEVGAGGSCAAAAGVSAHRRTRCQSRSRRCVKPPPDEEYFLRLWPSGTPGWQPCCAVLCIALIAALLLSSARPAAAALLAHQPCAPMCMDGPRHRWFHGKRSLVTPVLVSPGERRKNTLTDSLD
jgi:hypothetical protein